MELEELLKPLVDYEVLLRLYMEKFSNAEHYGVIGARDSTLSLIGTIRKNYHKLEETHKSEIYNSIKNRASTFLEIYRIECEDLGISSDVESLFCV